VCLCTCLRVCVFVCQVGVIVHAELKQPSTVSLEAMEDKIVSEYKIRLTADDPRNEALKKYLKELNLEPHDVLLVHSESIECCFICSSVELLMQLRRHFESGVMNNVLENIFTLLMNGDELIVINQLKWDSKNYWEGVQELNKLKPLG
jgi:hypothetical protein